MTDEAKQAKLIKQYAEVCLTEIKGIQRHMGNMVLHLESIIKVLE